jgi:tetratricopeptide (TPR) repeat protein
MTTCRRTAAWLALTLMPSLTAARAQQAQPITVAGLGTITFPVSTTSPAAESTFVRGVLLLHLFEYDDAAAEFRKARRLDPGMAMAYWGEAMSYTHPVWDQQDTAAARAVLAELGPTPAGREARAGTDIERGFVHAVDVLYGPGPKARRDTLYADAMDDLLRRHPGDDEVRSFYALAVLGLSQGVRELSTYVHAAAIAESVFVRNPRHPGAAHYWIHGLDDPAHAAGALPAARALADIAPDAGHAQHMTSHIFLALGMWDNVVRANVNAMRVVNRARHAAGRPETSCGHYNFWLEYGALELGRRNEARTLVEGCIRQSAVSPRSDATDPDNSLMGSAVGMWARYLIDTEDWSGKLARWTPSVEPGDPVRATWLFARGVAAARRGEVKVAQVALADYQATRQRLMRRYSGSTDPGDAEYLERLTILGLELLADVMLESNPPNGDSAVTLLRQATAIEDGMAYAFGPPFVDKPSHERLGEVLLALGKPADAKREFDAAARTTPNRALVKRGLERSDAGLPPGGERRGSR